MGLLPKWTLFLTFAFCLANCSGGRESTSSVLAGQSPFLSDLPACSGSDVHAIEVPIDYSNPSKGTIPYRFRYIEAPDGEGPPVLMVPGGPGGDFIRDTSAGVWLGSHVGRVLIAPRNMGCNYFDPAFPKENWSMQNEVLDMLRILKWLGEHHKLSQGYLVYGGSYGTGPATMLGALAEQYGYPQPRAVILEGVLAKSLNGERTFIENNKEIWLKELKEVHDYLKVAYPGKVVRIGGTSVTPYQNNFEWFISYAYTDSKARGYSFVHPAAVIRSASRTLGYYGNGPTYSNPVEGLLLLTYLADTDAKKLALLKIYNELSGESVRRIGNVESWPANADQYAQYIRCSELRSGSEPKDSLHSYYLDRKTLLPIYFDSKNSACVNVPFRKRYESSAYQIRAPIYYFQGEWDIATGLASAQYHFDTQKLAKTKELIVVPRAGHWPIAQNLSDCSSNLMDRILKQEPVRSFAEHSCKWFVGKYPSKHGIHSLTDAADRIIGLRRFLKDY